MPSINGSYRDAYIDEHYGKYVGVVRRERTIRRIFQLSPSTNDLHNEDFATRDEAGQRLIDLSAGDQ